MLDRKAVYFVGYASGIAGSDSGSGEGPGALKNSPLMAKFAQKGLQCHWGELIKSTNKEDPTLDRVVQQCTALADAVKYLVSQHRFFIVFGGDHSCAIGTWSGVYGALDSQDELGLIWIDAHMDSHTPETSPTGNIHGMPLASLLGHGDAKLINIMKDKPKLKPENICLIGTRSYEDGEAALLNKLNVRIFFMDEVKERGMEAVMKEALSIVKKNTTHFGVTLDIDAIDPTDAPGTGVVESDGIRAKDIYSAIQMLANEERLIGLEIAEFDPHKDKNHMTEMIISKVIESITLGEIYD
jgi:arginase